MISQAFEKISFFFLVGGSTTVGSEFTIVEVGVRACKILDLAMRAKCARLITFAFSVLS